MTITESFLRQARRVIIAVIGCTVLLVGVALLVLPGPAFLVIPAGLAILAIEFAWARRWLQRIKHLAEERGGRLLRRTPKNRTQQEQRLRRHRLPYTLTKGCAAWWPYRDIHGALHGASASFIASM